MVTYHAFGERKSLAAWSRDPRCQVTRPALTNRIKAGMPIEQAITAPPGGVRERKPKKPRIRRVANPKKRGFAAKLHEAFGEIKSVTEWSIDSRSRVGEATIYRRIQSGWAVETAIVTPPTDGEKPHTAWIIAWGERKSLREWASDPRCHVTRSTIRKRIASGWAPEEALSEPRGDRR